jgi:dynein assembly factor 2
MPVESINLFDKKDDFKPTADEMRVIADKMKDPEFAKLMAEYMESLSDPATKKEEEEYLAQMEREAKEGGDFSFEFIFPKGVFSVELVEVGQKKVIVNMCTSDKVDEYREETTNNRQSANWHVPVSISKDRSEQYNGQTYTVYDAVFNPKTMALAERSDKFVCFLVEVVVENINHGYKETFGFRFLRLPSSVKSVGQPQNQTVRKQNGKPAFPLSDEPVSKKPIKPTKTATATPAAAAAPAAASSTPSSKLPKHTILHRGEIDLTDAWNWKVVEKRIGVPKELLVKLELPDVASAAELDVDVTEHYIDISKSARHPYCGTIALPFTVDPTPAGAKFDRTKRILTLTLRVVPPEKPAEAIAPPELFPQIRSCGTEEPPRASSGPEPAVALAPAPAVEPQTSTPLPEAPAAATPALVEPVLPAVAAKPELHELSSDGDRMAQLMAKVAEARREREEAERLEAEAARNKSEPVAAPPQPKADDAVEVIDLRRKQQEWLEGVKQQERQRDEQQERLAEEAQLKADEEAKKKLKEARKRMEEEKEAERAAAKMKEAMDRLPLVSKYIFDIC